ncbi:hypothetical protein PV10_09123 [Exophiala mesophila]|uniref:Uncharacterized protein n=1 Tax=Exophiala mesophila TaxID=212818 RepID=A0A0D1XJ38_EXOME|nr:uncharacterized protein PV10_09123 [Exophiala mesophila]KIV88206.1 hypothetical protein PV10_09123 [Exophiala mesophila]
MVKIHCAFGLVAINAVLWQNRMVHAVPFSTDGDSVPAIQGDIHGGGALVFDPHTFTAMRGGLYTTPVSKRSPMPSPYTNIQGTASGKKAGLGPTPTIHNIATQSASIGVAQHTKSASSKGASALVYNKCTFPVNSNIVHGARGGNEAKPEEVLGILQPGQTWSHSFEHDRNLGVSWKIWRTDVDNTAPIQLEYTATDTSTWWDLSMVDAGEAGWLDESTEDVGNELADTTGDADGLGDYVGMVGIQHSFAEYGLSLVPVLDGNEVFEGNCVAVKCSAGESYCKSAYNTWNDWGQQKDCPSGVSLQLTLCG